MGILNWLSSHDIGEMEGDEYHYPKYTHGCWGGRREPLCWFCKFRYVKFLVTLPLRLRDVGDE